MTTNFNVLPDPETDTELIETGNSPITSSSPANNQCLRYDNSIHQYTYVTPISILTPNPIYTGNNVFTGTVQIGNGASTITQWLWNTTASIGPIPAMSSVDVTVNFATPFAVAPIVLATAQSTQTTDPALAVVVHNKSTTSAIIRLTNYTISPTTGTITVDWTAVR